MSIKKAFIGKTEEQIAAIRKRWREKKARQRKSNSIIGEFEKNMYKKITIAYMYYDFPHKNMMKWNEFKVIAKFFFIFLSKAIIEKGVFFKLPLNIGYLGVRKIPNTTMLIYKDYQAMKKNKKLLTPEMFVKVPMCKVIWYKGKNAYHNPKTSRLFQFKPSIPFKNDLSSHLSLYGTDKYLIN